MASGSASGSYAPTRGASAVLERDGIAAIFESASSSSAPCAELARDAFLRGVSAAKAHLAEAYLPWSEPLLRSAIAHCNAALIDAREEQQSLGLHANACAISIEFDQAVITHVGRCKVYLLGDHGALMPCTIDHRAARQLWSPDINLEDRTLVEPRVLGRDDAAVVDVALERAERGALFLLCTSGLPVAAGVEALNRAALTARDAPDAASAALCSLMESRRASGSWVWVSID